MQRGVISTASTATERGEKRNRAKRNQAKKGILRCLGRSAAGIRNDESPRSTQLRLRVADEAIGRQDRLNVAGVLDFALGSGRLALTFAHGGPKIDAPPPLLGQHNEEIRAELGFGMRELRA